MLRQEVFIVRIWRSQALSGWQWAARLDHLDQRTGGVSLRFSDPHAFLTHLRALVGAVDWPPAEVDAGGRSAERSLPSSPDAPDPTG